MIAIPHISLCLPLVSCFSLLGTPHLPPAPTPPPLAPPGIHQTVTHALLMANLVVAGRRLGPHAFIVPLRSLHDHQPLPGVTLGDIGMDSELHCIFIIVCA